jgi:GNAT superfamily N-acetyltransferase
VAEVEGSVVASVAYRPDPEAGEVELQMLYVLAPWRRRGLGSYLVALVEAEAARRGARDVVLWSDSRFTDAHRLYRSLGFQQQAAARALHDLSHSVEYRFAKALQP